MLSTVVVFGVVGVDARKKKKTKTTKTNSKMRTNLYDNTYEKSTRMTTMAMMLMMTMISTMILGWKHQISYHRRLHPLLVVEMTVMMTMGMATTVVFLVRCMVYVGHHPMLSSSM